LQLIEQTGFDEDSPQVVILDSTTLAPPKLNKNAAEIVFNTVKNLLSIVRNAKEYL